MGFPILRETQRDEPATMNKERQMNLFSLKDRVALVTGGNRGIGRGIAEGLAGHGARVACAARTRSQLDEAVDAIRAAGGEARAVEMDLEDRESTRHAVQAVLQHYGRIDILVNNAGMNIREPLEEVTEEHFDRILNVNLKALFFLTQAVAKHMIPRRQGKIIHIGSLTTGSALAKVSVYACTKGAVGSLTRTLALELGTHNIQVNAICPGFVVTALTEKLWADPQMRAWGEGRVALGRLAVPSDLAGTAVFLASPASDYVTGQLIYVDGGYMAGDLWPLPPPRK
jgi:NAD(P)-dependent dehydrogenase (short-subunit alcohol dehydrogenase family)